MAVADPKLANRFFAEHPLGDDYPWDWVMDKVTWERMHLEGTDILTAVADDRVPEVTVVDTTRRRFTLQLAGDADSDLFMEMVVELRRRHFDKNRLGQVQFLNLLL